MTERSERLLKNITRNLDFVRDELTEEKTKLFSDEDDLHFQHLQIENIWIAEYLQRYLIQAAKGLNEVDDLLFRAAVATRVAYLTECLTGNSFDSNSTSMMVNVRTACERKACQKTLQILQRY
ncbi:MAG: hypothetical protein DRP42_06790 [Tenericutes bacterium]|nr:MAG: hypothetical protein DRP42_06790 [Mycoplasmatota bacterium]